MFYYIFEVLIYKTELQCCEYKHFCIIYHRQQLIQFYKYMTTSWKNQISTTFTFGSIFFTTTVHFAESMASGLKIVFFIFLPYSIYIKVCFVFKSDDFRVLNCFSFFFDFMLILFYFVVFHIE